MIKEENSIRVTCKTILFYFEWSTFSIHEFNLRKKKSEIINKIKKKQENWLICNCFKDKKITLSSIV